VRAPTHEPAADIAEQLLAAVVELDPAAQPATLRQLQNQHPELADELQQRFLMFQRLAGLGPATAEEHEAPQRFGEYELVRELGRGGMGVVYLARQRRGDQDRLVALKLVRDRGLFSSQARERLRREGSAAFRLEHPSICQVLDVGEVDGVPFLTMRYVPGTTLAEQIAMARATNAPLVLPHEAIAPAESGSSVTGLGGERVRTIVGAIEQVARALHVAHAAGLVHRDVKPGNIMVTPDGVPVLLDFGLVHDAASTSGLTVSGSRWARPPTCRPNKSNPRVAASTAPPTSTRSASRCTRR
jgi:serine/threonine-protein kinase